jgi:dihydrofolate synthase/folylpolyglutamate synthase
MDVQERYRQTVDYLFDHLPMFSRIGKAALKSDLSNTIKLCEALGNPQHQFKSIHIAGTNGKGSVSHSIAAIMQEAGYKTGLYTSPHLVDFRERIRVDGRMISMEWVIDFVEKVKPLIEEIQPSFFEITVAMAFHFFAEQKVDIAVIETGLGGRLDSTNVITPLLSIITNISYDHTDLLGKTLPEIAAEKAGIIKEKVPVVIGEQNQETERVFFEKAMHKQSTIYYAETQWDLVRTGQDEQYQYFKAVHRAKREMHDLKTDLIGNYQQQNLKTVLTAAELLNACGEFELPLSKQLTALAKVKKLSGLRGRWEILRKNPLIVADVAHNPAGMKEVLQQWRQVEAAQKHIVLGFVKDKDVSDVLSLFPADAQYYYCNAQIPRALPASELADMATTAGLNGTIYESVASAIETAKNNMDANDALLVTGSFFIVGEAMEYMHVSSGLLFPASLE